MPMVSATTVHFFAFLDARLDSSYRVWSCSEFTFIAFTMPAIPNGKQQKIVARIDSTNHVLALTGVWFSITGGVGGMGGVGGVGGVGG